MYDEEGLIEYLDERLVSSMSYRHEIGIDRSLKIADQIMFDDGRKCSKRDMNQNFLRRKIFSLYTLLANQLESQRQKAVGIEITGDDDAPDELYQSVADEIIEELLYQKSILETGRVIGVVPFLETIKHHYEIRSKRMEKEITDTLASVEPELRKILFSSSNKEEIRKVLRDYAMYPSCFVYGTYDEISYNEDFIRGRVVRSNKTKVSFRRVSPWRVYPVPSKKSISNGGDCFIVEDFSIESLHQLKDKSANKENIQEIIDDMDMDKTTNCTWFSDQVYKIEGYDEEIAYYKDHKTIARAVMYDGYIPKKYLEKDANGYTFGQIWFIDKKVIFSNINEDERKPMIMSASFRPGKYGTWGIGTVDLCYRIQRTIDFIGEKIVGNIEKLSDFQGLLDADVAKSMIRDKKGGDGKANIDITGVNVATIPLNRTPFYRFPIGNSQQSGMLMINELKRHIAEILSLPDFVDGSTNVGTVGRTSGGLFLLQRNLSEGIEHVRKEFVNQIIVPISRAILEKIKDQGKLSKIILNYDVVVRDFALEEERSESADELLKKVQAVTQLQQTLQASGVNVRNNEVLKELHNSIIKDIAPNQYIDESDGFADQDQTQQQVDSSGLSEDEIRQALASNT